VASVARDAIVGRGLLVVSAVFGLHGNIYVGMNGRKRKKKKNKKRRFENRSVNLNHLEEYRTKAYSARCVVSNLFISFFEDFELKKRPSPGWTRSAGLRARFHVIDCEVGPLG
jgi:hypothetical protein